MQGCAGFFSHCWLLGSRPGCSRSVPGPSSRTLSPTPATPLRPGRWTLHRATVTAHQRAVPSRRTSRVGGDVNFDRTVDNCGSSSENAGSCVATCGSRSRVDQRHGCVERRLPVTLIVRQPAESWARRLTVTACSDGGTGHCGRCQHPCGFLHECERPRVHVRECPQLTDSQTLPRYVRPRPYTTAR